MLCFRLKLCQHLGHQIYFTESGFHGPESRFVCDRYVSPSIKDLEPLHRNLRDQITTRVFHHRFPTKTPQDFHEAFSSGQFKTALLGFLILEWQKDDYVNVLKKHIVDLGIADAAYQFTVEANVISKENLFKPGRG